MGADKTFRDFMRHRDLEARHPLHPLVWRPQEMKFIGPLLGIITLQKWASIGQYMFAICVDLFSNHFGLFSATFYHRFSIT